MLWIDVKRAAAGQLLVLVLLVASALKKSNNWSWGCIPEHHANSIAALVNLFRHLLSEIISKVIRMVQSMNLISSVHNMCLKATLGSFLPVQNKTFVYLSQYLCWLQPLPGKGVQQHGGVTCRNSNQRLLIDIALTSDWPSFNFLLHFWKGSKLVFSSLN